MKAVLYEAFRGPLEIREVPDPAAAPHGAVIEVKATGLCRSDWHGWMGHDPDIRLPHVPGHELAGAIAALGAEVRGWRVGERVTLPFACGCGSCPECASGNPQVCERQSQPGFTHWGSFAEFVAIEHAAVNLVRLPAELDYASAASLGCRFATAFRAVVDQGRTAPGQWVAVHGCGGVGLSAIMIADAVGAAVVAVDITPEKLALADSLGAAATIDATRTDDVAAAVIAHTGGGAHVSIDALGSPQTCYDSVACLRRRGRHVQVGLLGSEARHTAVPMDRVIFHELEILGTHGLQAYRYRELLAMMREDKLQPARLIGDRIPLAEVPRALVAMDGFRGSGVTIIEP